MPMLLVAVEGSGTSAEAVAFDALAVQLAARERRWSIEPPRSIDQVEAPGDVEQGYEPLRTVGLVLLLPAVEASTSEAAVRADLTLLLTECSALAAWLDNSLVIEYDQDQIGFLEGVPDDLLVVAHFFGDDAL